MFEAEIAIVAHPSRTIQVMSMADTVGAAAISWDTRALGAQKNHEQAWTYLMSSPTPWVVCLEDDAVPVVGFRHQLAQVLAACPGDICSLYLGRGRPDHWQLPISAAISADVCFLRSFTLLSNVGYAIRTPLLKELYVYTRHPGSQPKVELAEAMSRWARKTHRPIYYSRPSIVDHMDGPPVIQDHQREDGQSRAVAPHPTGTKVRKAWLCDGRESWDSSWTAIPPPDLRRRDKVSRHLAVVHLPSSPSQE